MFINSLYLFGKKNFYTRCAGLSVYALLTVLIPPPHIPVPTRRFSHIHVGLVGPLPASKGFTYLFTIIDRTSR